jgi:outer membrane protein TolC
VRNEVQALYSAGLVPRVDQLRAEAQLQQSRMKLEQATALVLSRQRQLSNLINAPYTVTLTATEAVRLQPPWPLDLQQTLVRGFDANPQLIALDAARRALSNQADRHAAELLPRLHLFAVAGGGQQLSTKPIIDLKGCCASSQIPQLGSQSADWAAGLRLNWRLFDGATSQSLAAASRAAAERTEQEMARSRNDVRQQLETAFYDHRAALQQIVAARAAFKAAREAFRDVRARYQLGLANYTDVSTTVLLLTGAMEGVAEAITVANVSYAQLLRQLLPVPEQPPASVPVLPLVLESGSGS